MTTRVQLGRLDSITGGTDQYGLYVSGPDGRVIIDGTSDVLQIVAEGGMQLTGCNGSGAACSVSGNVEIYTGLTMVPAHLGYLGLSARIENLPRTVINNVAGGGTVLDHIRGFTENVGGGVTRYTINWETGANRSANTYDFHFFILDEEGGLG